MWWRQSNPRYLLSAGHLISAHSPAHSIPSQLSGLLCHIFSSVCVCGSDDGDRDKDIINCFSVNSLNQGQSGPQLMYLQSLTVVCLTRECAGSRSRRACPTLCHIRLHRCSQRSSHCGLTYRTHLVRGHTIPLTNTFLCVFYSLTL